MPRACPVRCIEVSSPDGLFLVTKSFVPTHNSSLGRLGLLIHSTAGFIDPGWDGHVTLELSNVANLPITIYPGMKIGQLSFMQLTEPAVARRTGRAGSARSTRASAGRRRAGTGRTSWQERRLSDRSFVTTGGTGFVGSTASCDALRARGVATCARSSGGPTRGAARSRAGASSSPSGDVTDAASVAPAPSPAARTSCTSSRSSAAATTDFRARDGRGLRRTSLAAAREAGVAARRADERARHERGRRRTSVPY